MCWGYTLLFEVQETPPHACVWRVEPALSAPPGYVAQRCAVCLRVRPGRPWR